MVRLNWIIFVQNVQKITLEVNADDEIDYLLVMCKKYPKIGLNLEFKLNSKFESGLGSRIYHYYI